jgi:hypothetical protein
VHGEFDDSMSFDRNDLTVCGPLFFGGTSPHELAADEINILALVVVQTTAGLEIGHAPSPAINNPFKPGVTEWMGHVNGNWVAGPAHAMAAVQLTINGRQRKWIFETWSETLTIFAAT